MKRREYVGIIKDQNYEIIAGDFKGKTGIASIYGASVLKDNWRGIIKLKTKSGISLEFLANRDKGEEVWSCQSRAERYKIDVVEYDEVDAFSAHFHDFEESKEIAMSYLQYG